MNSVSPVTTSLTKDDILRLPANAYQIPAQVPETKADSYESGSSKKSKVLKAVGIAAGVAAAAVLLKRFAGFSAQAAKEAGSGKVMTFIKSNVGKLANIVEWPFVKLASFLPKAGKVAAEEAPKTVG